MKQLAIITTLFLVSLKTFAHNPFWTQQDKKLIEALTKIDKTNTSEIEQYFVSRLRLSSQKKENLGFGWTMWQTGIGGGYIAISAQFFYYNDSLISYSLTPQLPEEKGLQKRYKKWYGNYFSYINSEIQDYRFNSESILKPLKEYVGNVTAIREKLINYMSPNSGTTYGYSGSLGILENRKAFLEIKDSMGNDELFLLMFSINPASRLTAIEYYLKRKESFNNQEAIENWIELNFKEIRTIETSGCFKDSVETKSLVYMLSLKADK